ncbi:MAG: hypothetical protein ACREBF_03655 [Candidatus Micrarchaeales archaeon]
MLLAGILDSATSSLPLGSGPQLDAILIFFVILLTVRMYRGLKGMKYRAFRLYLLPIVYLLLTIYSLFELAPSYLDIPGVVVALLAGYFIGIKFGSSVQFYEQEGQTHYKRSPIILIIWLASFVARFVLEAFLPNVFYINFGIELFLALTTGMIIGEAFHIMRKHRLHKESTKSTS